MSALNGHLPHVHISEPGDGWAYSVLISELPHHGFMGGGSPDDFVVVTVWRPFDRGIGRTYVMAKSGTLTDRYVQEKFGIGVSDPVIVHHIANAIRSALGRPALEDENWL
jgi:hypothetical protein